MGLLTADISDEHGEAVTVLPALKNYGGAQSFTGPIATLRATSSGPVRELLGQPGDGRVLVIAAAGANGAVVGYRSADLAYRNGWRGIVLDGLVRDTQQIAGLGIGVCARGSTPRRATGEASEADDTVQFGDFAVSPGQHLYADADGIVVTSLALNP